ncbi:MAG: motb protein [Zetaproteobacteria bacterium]|nr:MAG: motb protein [Zetaproteobacteria bacterium]
MARRKRQYPVEYKPNPEAWMTTFADLISLMLTFFILIVSMSTLDKTGLEDISTYFRWAVSTLNAGSRTELQLVPPAVVQRIVSPRELMLALRQNSRAVLRHSVLEHKVRATIERDRLHLRLPNAVLFAPGSAKLDPRARKALERLAKMLATAPGSIRIEGHADPHEAPRVDPWRLSLKRAASVLQVFENAGIAPARLAIAGYGPAHPVSTMRTPYGRMRNNRVEIVIAKEE